MGARCLEFSLVNKNWFEDFSSRILRDTAKGLGVLELRADPHRLLLYEPGSFFQTHSDPEKEQDMIGTLVIPNDGVSGLISNVLWSSRTCKFL